jgi:ribonuclease T2
MAAANPACHPAYNARAKWGNLALSCTACGPMRRGRIIRAIAAVIAQNICMTPDVQLLQHEWAKHGTCMARRPEAYFAAAKLMYDAIEFPDMDRLSRAGSKQSAAPLTAKALAQAFADINEGLPASAVAISTSGRGWLKEVRICLGKKFRPVTCPAFSRGARPGSVVKIWRGT